MIRHLRLESCFTVIVIVWFGLVFLFKGIASHCAVQAGLELTVYPSLDLSLKQSSSLSL